MISNIISQGAAGFTDTHNTKYNFVLKKNANTNKQTVKTGQIIFLFGITIIPKIKCVTPFIT